MIICTRSLFLLVVILIVHSKLCDAGLKKGNCPEKFVSCENGDCISRYDECDGIPNCSDGSDEIHPICMQKRCPIKTFRCAYGACIDESAKCDGKYDCADRSDELSLSSSCGLQWLNNASSLPCREDQIQCRNGECIPRTSLCDGKINCSDKSDESILICYGGKITSCPIGSFRCAYGGCISSANKCDFKEDCADGSDEHYLLCNRPKNQTTISLSKVCTVPSIEGLTFRCRENKDSLNCTLNPGSPVADQDFVLFHCEKGFITKEEFKILRCSNQTWSRESALNSLCLRVCPPLESSLSDFSCIYKNKTVDCSSSLPGTIATAVCKEGYGTNNTLRQFSCLSNSQWETFDLSCEKICGILNPITVNDQSNIVVKHPWNVGIYVQNKKGKFEQFCSGTLISPLKVLTAANCMQNQKIDKWRQLTRLRIVLGKYHSNFYHLQDENFQVREIVDFVKPKNYKGRSNNYYNDIAILKLSSAVEINNYALPICIDKNRLYKLSPDRPGSIVGWHLSKGSSSEIGNLESRCTDMCQDRTLMSGQLPYMPRNECSNYLSSFLTFDKFCAFSPTGTNVTSVCNFDSGAGLTFKINDVHYIYGIATTLVKSIDIRETRNFINTFTDLTYDELLKFVIDNL